MVLHMFEKNHQAYSQLSLKQHYLVEIKWEPHRQFIFFSSNHVKKCKQKEVRLILVLYLS